MANSQGVELMRQINDGAFEVAPSDYLLATRRAISTELEELIEVGARIRPLLLDKRRIGWVRGVHLSERKALKRYLHDDQDFFEQLIQLGSTVPREDVEEMSLMEIRSICRVIQAMTESDLKLYAYVSPFVSTNTSEQLWYALGTDLTSYRDRIVPLPDGKQLRVAVPPDQARLWATLCNYRIQAKERLDASMNAVLTIRPLVGKSADSLSNELKAISRSLATDALEPWRESVRYREEVNYNDGWAHSDDDSKEGILRELNNMVSNDRHEQLFAQFDKQEQERAEKRKAEIDSRIAKRGGPGFFESSTKRMTATEVEDRATRLRAGGLKPVAVLQDENESSPVDRLAKYR